MPVKIRLAQRGKKKNRTFRVIVADSRSPRDGKFIEDLGFYNPQDNPSSVEIDVEKAVGMFFYDSEKVLKKIGVKKSSDNFNLVAAILKKFNRELNQIRRINSFLFSEGKAKIDYARKESVKSGDFNIIRNATKEVTTMFDPIIEVVKESEKNLDLELEKILSSKELNKWLKYKRNMKKK